MVGVISSSRKCNLEMSWPIVRFQVAQPFSIDCDSIILPYDVRHCNVEKSLRVENKLTLLALHLF